jgi:hypothetical protein
LHTAVAEYKLADLSVPAAEFPTGIVALDGHGERGSGRTRVANGVVPIEDAAVVRIQSFKSAWDVLVSDKQGIAQTVGNLIESDALDGTESTVWFKRSAARKRDGVVEARRSN